MKMDAQELQHLFSSDETQRVERKRSDADLKKIRRTACAFANDLSDSQKPGVIFVGQEDNGDCSDIVINDALLKKLADIRESIFPFPSIVIDELILDECHVAVVIVHPSSQTPLRLDGRTWVRIGPTTRQGTPEDERILTEKRRSKELPFDIRPIESSSEKDINYDYFLASYLPNAVDRETLEQNNRTTPEKLSSLRMTDPNGVPTFIGITTLSPYPRDFIPGFYIQFLKVNGDKLTDDITDQKEIDGTLVDILSAIDRLLDLTIEMPAVYREKNREIRKKAYPKEALQQLIRNAILHRNYENSNAPVKVYWFNDRIEIHNPGGPFGAVNKHNFGNPGVTDYRNPNLAEVMKNLGYVQKFGSGIMIAEESLFENGNPKPDFTVEDNNILVTVWR